MVGEYRSHKLPQAWERQKKLPLLFCFPLHFCWDDFAAPFPCPLLSGQEQEVALPCVLCMCGFMYGLSQPSLFGCLHPKKAMPSLGSVPAFLLTLSERGPSHVFEADTFLFCQRLTAKGHRFASPFHSLAGCLLTSIKVQCYQAWFLSQLPLPSFHILHLFLALPVVCALSEVFSQPRNCPIQISSLSEMILILLLDYFANS